MEGKRSEAVEEKLAVEEEKQPSERCGGGREAAE
ncbi:hypothetical protein L195_g018086 [Trifolium pratense]|uniref:Uncharacterized protein n=1 Tax=Trifolium pratense TaxID=57577 RepID=A0A2K3MVZ4_TRIPR|nr:hypothetical protein L195_g018086 [Trifolium pratense]